MKNDKTPEAVISELLDLVPARKATAVTDLYSPENTPGKDSAKSGVELVLNAEAKKLTNTYFENQNEEPRFCYVGHVKKDGVLAARSLHRMLSSDQKGDKAVYNPAINEKDLSVHIREKQLRKQAIEAGYATRRTIPVWQTFASVLAGFGAVIGAVAPMMEIAQSLDADVVLRNFFGSFQIWAYVAILVIFAACICSMIIQSRKNRRDIIIELNNRLNEASDDDFLEFLNRFSGEEIAIPDCKNVKSDKPVYICALQSYNYRQRRILKAYWSGASKKQLWFIFMEETAESKTLVLEPSKARERRLYRMKPLAKSEKKQLANRVYTEKVPFRPDEDSGINTHGVDYICRFRLKEREPIAEAEQLQDKIKEFCREYASGYQADIKLVIRLMAELSCNYGIDFANRRSWEYLFSYQIGDPETITLDKEVTARLQLDNRTIKNLVPEIQHNFGGFYEEIVAGYQSTEQTSEYKQWCLLKALRCREDQKEDRYLTVADLLMSEWQYPEDMCSPVWVGILIQTMQVFYRRQIFWFLPSLVHKLIGICQTGRHQLPGTVFSNPVVLEVARANLLLNINSSEEVDRPSHIDLIRDHFQVVVMAAKELNRELNLESNQSMPSCLELLQLSAPERQRYYNALVYLKEQVVLDYYGYQFDIYCASLFLAGREIRFCYKELYDNTLYEKYGRKNRLVDPSYQTYIRIILNQLLDLVEDTYAERFAAVGNAVEELREILNREDTENAAQRILFLLAKFDILGVVTLNYLACMVARLDDSRTIPNDVYLSLGNYLIALVFLTYHENTQDTFYNHDFIHMVRLCTSYTEPSGAVLGYMYFCDTRFKSVAASELIRNFINRHKVRYVQNLERVVQQIKRDDLELFLSFAECITLSKEDKLPVLEDLRKMVAANYGDSSKAPVILEYLSLYIDGVSTQTFRDDTPENNLAKLEQTTDDMVYMIYNRYLALDHVRYMELCPLVAERVLGSSMISCVVPIAHYAVYAKDKDSQAYAETARALYRHLKESRLRYKVKALNVCALFIVTCMDKKKAEAPAYQWVDIKDAKELFARIEAEREERILTQAWEFLGQRTWNKYGMILFLRYMMTDLSIVKNAPDEAYDKLDEQQKTQYIIDNCTKLPPVVEWKGKKVFSEVYVDMLTAFVNNADMQGQVDEKACLRKFANDALLVIENIPPVSGRCKEDLQMLAKEYLHMLERE